MNHLYYADNLIVMQDMPDASVDIVIADPPFNTGRDFAGYTDTWKGKSHPEDNTHQNALSADYPETGSLLNFIGGEKPIYRSWHRAFVISIAC